MLGLVSTEFVELIDGRFLPEAADVVATALTLRHRTACTTVGDRPQVTMQSLPGSLLRHTACHGLAGAMLPTLVKRVP